MENTTQVIAKKHRFHGHNSVARVRGSVSRAAYFSVYYAPSKKRSTYRMAVVVSKKISKSAVVRNRIRRRLYEAVRTNKLLDDYPVDVVFVVHQETVAYLDSAELAQQIQKICSQIINDPKTTVR